MWALMDHNMQLMEDLAHANLDLPGPHLLPNTSAQAVLVSPACPSVCGLPHDRNLGSPGIVVNPSRARHQQDAGHACTCSRYMLHLPVPAHLT